MKIKCQESESGMGIAKITCCKQNTVYSNLSHAEHITSLLHSFDGLSTQFYTYGKHFSTFISHQVYYDNMTLQIGWCYHRKWCHDVVLCTTKMTSKLDYLLKIKAWEKNNQSLHSGRDKGIPSLCLWFATSTTWQASSWIANHGHSDGIPLSLSEWSDWFY